MLFIDLSKAQRIALVGGWRASNLMVKCHVRTLRSLVKRGLAQTGDFEDIGHLTLKGYDLVQNAYLAGFKFTQKGSNKMEMKLSSKQWAALEYAGQEVYGWTAKLHPLTLKSLVKRGLVEHPNSDDPFGRLTGFGREVLVERQEFAGYLGLCRKQKNLYKKEQEAIEKGRKEKQAALVHSTPLIPFLERTPAERKALVDAWSSPVHRTQADEETIEALVEAGLFTRFDASNSDWGEATDAGLQVVEEAFVLGIDVGEHPEERAKRCAAFREKIQAKKERMRVDASAADVIQQAERRGRILSGDREKQLADLQDRLAASRVRRAARDKKAELLRKFRDPIPVLDHGYVQLIDVMGDDEAIVAAARTSYVGHATDEATRTDEQNRQLIRLLMRSGHSTPFEMVEIKVQIKIPMDAWRQMVRQRTASISEYSTRYRKAIEEVAATDPKSWRLQAQSSKQGSSGSLDEWTDETFDLCPPEEHAWDLSPGEFLTERERELHDLTEAIYEERLALGVAREQARKDLSLSNYTEVVWKIDGNNLLKFLRQRLDPHAQYEIRQYAEALYRIVRAWLPLTAEAFQDYAIDAVTFSGPEMEHLRIILLEASRTDLDNALGLARDVVFDQDDRISKREAVSFFRSLEGPGDA